MKTQKSPRLLLQVHTAIAAIKHWENIITPCRPAAMASRCTFRHMVMWGAVLALGLLLRTTHAQNAYNIEYLCCDWGPAMTLPSNTNEVVKFNEKEEEVYFLKQVASRSPKSVNIYLCKMKADGSDKTELKELWRNPSFPIDTQGQSTWMDVNRKARKLALSITYAGSDIDGLWVIKLDGCDLRRIITPICTTNYLQAINHPSWTPDGEWLVFEEELRGTNPNQHRIAKCDKDGKNFVLLTKGPWQDQPSVFPDGRSIIYGQVGDAKTGGIYLMDIEGNSPHLLPNPDDKRYGKHSGLYPALSPDGQKILLSGVGLINAVNGKTLWRGVPQRAGKGHSWGWAHFGKAGVIGYNLTGILFTDTDIKTSKTLGISRQEDAKGGSVLCKW